MLVKLKNKHGYTLIEIIVVVGLITIISGVMSTFLVQSFASYRVKKQSVELEEKAASVMREFEYSTRAASEILTVSEDELIYYRFFDLVAASPTQVRYFMDGNVFKVGLIEPVGVEPDITYPHGNEVIDLIVGDVTNQTAIFKYYDGLNNELSAPYNIESIKLVELEISLDKDGNNPPLPISQTTKVNLRNMKDNL